VRRCGLAVVEGAPTTESGAYQAMGDRLQEQRYESKYWLDERKALRVRQFVQSHLELDEYSACQPDLSYPTLSLYLDSGALQTYWQTICGDKNRFKLRLRYYDDLPDSPVFFEVKRREDNVILKQRTAVRKDAVRWLLAGHLPLPEYLLNPGDAQALAALQRFCQHMFDLRACPKMHVAYLREAYEQPGNKSVRVTFDRRVESAPQHDDKLIARAPGAHSVFGNIVVLELKFTTRFPNWFRELVETFDCMQEGAAKYATGIFDHGEDWVLKPNSPDRLLEEFLSAEHYPGLFRNARRGVGA
jgi:hypothetical protein